MKSTKVNYRFPFWLTVIFFGLIAIPTLIYIGGNLYAKLIGVFILLLTSIALRYWLLISKKSAVKNERVVLNKNDIFDLERKWKFFKSFNKEEKAILLNRMGLFLANTPMVDELQQLLSRETSVEIALFLSLYFLESPEMSYDFTFVHGRGKEFSCKNNQNALVYEGDHEPILFEINQKRNESSLNSVVKHLIEKKIKNFI